MLSVSCMAAGMSEGSWQTQKWNIDPERCICSGYRAGAFSCMAVFNKLPIKPVVNKCRRILNMIKNTKYSRKNDSIY